MTPITVLQGVCGFVPILKRLPTGSWFGQRRLAIVWLTTATGAVPGPSSIENVRPRSTGMPIALK